MLGCVRVQAGVALGAADAGTTKDVAVGSEVRLTLPADYVWTVESTNTSALALKSSVLGTVGEQSVRIWLFDARTAGDYVLRASGSHPCESANPACSPSVQYRFNLRVR